MEVDKKMATGAIAAAIILGAAASGWIPEINFGSLAWPLFIAAVFALFYFAKMQKGKVDQSWKKIAAMTGLSFEDKGILFFANPRMKGNYKGKNIEVFTEARGYGRSRQTYTIAQAGCRNPEGIRLRVYNEGIFQKIGKVFGVQDIKVGSEQYDSRFMFQLSDPRMSHNVFSPNILSGIGRLEGWIDIRLENNIVRFERLGLIEDAEKIKAVMDVIADIAEAADSL